MSKIVWKVKKGDRLERVVDFTKTDHDWYGTTVKASVVETYRGTPKATPSLTVSYPEVGTMRVLVVLTGAQTAALEVRRYILDFVVERSSPQFGPYTPIEVILDIQPRGTA